MTIDNLRPSGARPRSKVDGGGDVPSRPSYSLLLTAFDEAENIGPVLDEIYAVLTGTLDFDVVVVDDGSTDGTDRIVLDRAARLPGITLVRHARRIGKSGALVSGARAARGEWLVMMDADGQNDPRDIMPVIAEYDLRGGPNTALVYGIRAKRRDTISRRLASRLANGIRRVMLHDGCPDTGCGLKLMRRDVFLMLPYFNGLHRFIPALVGARGYGQIGLAVNDRPRIAGQSKVTNVGRAVVGFFDLFGVMWLIRRASITEAEVFAPSATNEDIAEESRVGIG